MILSSYELKEDQYLLNSYFSFSISFGKIKYPLILAQPLDALVPEDKKEKDIDLGLIRVCAQPRQHAEIFSAASIIRGALLVRDFGENMDGNYLVMDIIDGDMFLRMKELGNVNIV